MRSSLAHHCDDVRADANNDITRERKNRRDGGRLQQLLLRWCRNESREFLREFIQFGDVVVDVFAGRNQTLISRLRNS